MKNVISIKKSNYHKFPKYSDTQNICCNHSKNWTVWLYHRRMSPNDAGGMANSVDPDQTAPRSSLIWVCTVCPAISVRKLGIIMVSTKWFQRLFYGNYEFCTWHMLSMCHNQTPRKRGNNLMYCCCLFGFNVTFNNFSVVSRQCLVATGSSLLTFLTFIVLPHRSITPQHLTWYHTQSHYPDTGLTSSSSTP